MTQANTSQVSDWQVVGITCRQCGQRHEYRCIIVAHCDRWHDVWFEYEDTLALERTGLCRVCHHSNWKATRRDTSQLDGRDWYRLWIDYDTRAMRAARRTDDEAWANYLRRTSRT